MNEELEIVELNDGHYHEALDRCFCVIEIIDNMLSDHPAIAQTALWKEKIDAVQEILADLYQLIGQKEYEFNKSSEM